MMFLLLFLFNFSALFFVIGDIRSRIAGSMTEIVGNVKHRYIINYNDFVALHSIGKYSEGLRVLIRVEYCTHIINYTEIQYISKKTYLLNIFRKYVAN